MGPVLVVMNIRKQFAVIFYVVALLLVSGNTLATITYTGGARAGGTSTSASVTHGQTINSGDLVVAYVNSNSTDAISADAGGVSFTEEVDETPAGDTARHAFYWKIAGASEPSSYSFTVGSAQWQVIVKVFAADDTIVEDAAAVSSRYATLSQSIVIDAIDGETISDGAVSIVAGGHDNRTPSIFFDDATPTDYVGELGKADDQSAGMAHKIYTTGATFSGNVDIAPNNFSNNDSTHNVHMSFVEFTGSSDTPLRRRRTE